MVVYGPAKLGLGECGPLKCCMVQVAHGIDG